MLRIADRKQLTWTDLDLLDRTQGLIFQVFLVEAESSSVSLTLETDTLYTVTFPAITH